MFTFLGNWWFSLTSFQLGTNKVSMLFYFRYKTVLEFGDTSDTKFHDNVSVHFSALIPSPVSYPYFGIISFWNRQFNHDFWGNTPFCHCLSTQPSTTRSRNLLTLTSFSIFSVTTRQRSYEWIVQNFSYFCPLCTTKIQMAYSTLFCIYVKTTNAKHAAQIVYMHCSLWGFPQFKRWNFSVQVLVRYITSIPATTSLTEEYLYHKQTTFSK